MSAEFKNSRSSRKRRRDFGLTLPELLITITLMGLLATVLSAAITVTLRQADSTEGRANVARSESSVDTWLPADLASTDVNNLDVAGTGFPAVELDPAAEPCGLCGSIDLSGTNAMQLAWETNGIVTRVQYQYIQVDDEWMLRRISCVDGQPCSVTVILHDLEGPPDPSTFNPDADRPVWVMDVAVPADPTGLELDDNARQIVVTIDGGGENIGSGGGLNSINLTAGGRSTEEIDADDFTVPSFVRAKSRCGGPVTLMVDRSGSINFGGNNNMDDVVIPGVRAFIEAFRGTPTQLQIVSFNHKAQVDGPGSDWNRYIDMTDDSLVDQMLTTVNGYSAGGGTNWEGAFFRTLKASDGSAADILPNRIVFFTDGVPTYNRASFDGAWDSIFYSGDQINYNAGVYNRSSGWDTEEGYYHQESFDRADVLLDGHRNIDMIFVGVGGGLQGNYNWRYDPNAYQNPNTPEPSATTKTGADILAYLLANAPSGQVPATSVTHPDGTVEYTNPETADFYNQTSFDEEAFGAAMRAAALKDCGGTLTVQTRLSNGDPVGDEVVYENADYRDDTGTTLGAEPRRVTTSTNFRTGTFDFEISDSSDYFEVDIVPSELETLGDYNFVGWTCRAGATDKTAGMTSIPIDGSSFEGFAVNVLPNEAVSCIMEVTQ